MDIKELESKISLLKKGSGDKGTVRQHSLLKLTSRERIARFLDENSFSEIGLFAKHRATAFDMDKKDIPYDAVITGYGTINNRPCFCSFQDFTLSGGTLGEVHAQKIAQCQEKALEAGVPFISVNDSGGARIQEGVDALAGFGRLFFNNTRASGVIPQISVIAGPCAGGAVYSPALTDFIFMIDRISNMFITGPQVIKAVTGEEIDTESLGGAHAHNTKSGVAHFYAETEDECFAAIRRLLSFLPQNNLDEVPLVRNSDDPNRECSLLDSIIPESASKAYDVRDVIRNIVDEGDFMEVHEFFATNIVVGFARFNGKSVGIVANQPKVNSGSLDSDASDKAARFIRTCDSFGIPLVTFVDVPGFLPGVKEEHKGIIRHGAKLLYAYSEATVPKVTIILRKAYGGAYIAMCSKHLGADMVFAWPSAEIAVMGAEGAVNILYSKELKEAKDSSFRIEKIEEYKRELLNPLRAAERGYVDDIIIPATSRKRIISALQLLKDKKVNKIQKRHGNIPL